MRLLSTFATTLTLAALPAIAQTSLTPPQAGDPDYMAHYRAWAEASVAARNAQNQAFAQKRRAQIDAQQAAQQQAYNEAQARTAEASRKMAEEHQQALARLAAAQHPDPEPEVVGHAEPGDQARKQAAYQAFLNKADQDRGDPGKERADADAIRASWKQAEADLKYRQAHPEIAQAEQAQARQAEQQRAASYLPQCQSTSIVQTVSNIINKMRDSDGDPYQLLKLYNVRGFTSKDSTQLAARAAYSTLIRQSDIPYDQATKITKGMDEPFCAASAVLSQGEQDFVYSWKVIDGQTFVTVEKVEDQPSPLGSKQRCGFCESLSPLRSPRHACPMHTQLGKKSALHAALLRSRLRT